MDSIFAKWSEFIVEYDGPFILPVNEEKWEQEVSFIPQVAGYDQKVEFLLYRNEEIEPYLTLHLFIDVKERS